ncbi:MAG: hypothetical protein AB7I13_00170 [Vicinamibacterales bacterium]
MDFRISLANATAEQVAQIAIGLGLAGSVLTAVGFGAWGIEATVIVEIGGVTTEQADALVAALFAAFPKEEAVYVHDGRKGRVVYRAGRVE